MCDGVKGETRVTGIFGHPIGHSLSPRMHNAAFRAVGLNMIYLPFEVKAEDLSHAIEAVRALNLVGVNLTQPHKIAALRYLDGLSESAARIGAVNTVVNRKGKLVGYNTDAVGFLQSLGEDYGFDPRGKRIVVFGAGGAARAICWILSTVGPARLVVVNRTVEKAGVLAEACGGQALGWPDPGVAAEVSEADLVVNATSTDLNLPPDAVSSPALFYDIGYAQSGSSAQRQVRKKEGRVAGGLSMLLYQGAAAFELWTAHRAPLEVMRQALKF
jgi:shikimate dehydrogenase